ncbi:MAG: hypothetical protein ACKOX6_10670 [Bdellovibrio sp.]
MKTIALAIVGFSLLSLVALLPAPHDSTSSDVIAFKTEGRCMSKILDKSPRFFPTDKCYLG